MNNETYGISVEVAIAEAYGVPISPDYTERADRTVVENIKPLMIDTFEAYQLPYPYRHTAENGNPVDFLLEDGSTLSVKSNLDNFGKAAPQIVGQPTSTTWYEYFGGFIDDPQDYSYYYDYSYEERIEVFKRTVINHIAELMTIYWEHIFECDYLLAAYNLVQGEGAYAETRVIGKYIPPYWTNDQFTFTQSLETWNESTTLKWNGITIGEFQAHHNRDCFKFRFNMNNLVELIENGSFGI